MCSSGRRLSIEAESVIVSCARRGAALASVSVLAQVLVLASVGVPRLTRALPVAPLLLHIRRPPLAPPPLGGPTGGEEGAARPAGAAVPRIAAQRGAGDTPPPPPLRLRPYRAPPPPGRAAYSRPRAAGAPPTAGRRPRRRTAMSIVLLGDLRYVRLELGCYGCSYVKIETLTL